MNDDFSDALHIVFGDSAAGSLKVALRLSKNQILVNEDPLSCGPAQITDNFAQWRSLRESFVKCMYIDWPEFSFDEYSDNGLLSNTHKLTDSKPIVVWASRSLGEQLLIAWLTSLYDQLNLKFSNFFIVQFQQIRDRQIIRGIGELSPENIQDYSPDPVRLAEEEIYEYQAAWSSYTSSDTADLIKFLSKEPINKSLHTAMNELIYRYPSEQNGLSRCDEELLSYTETKGPNVARIIGYAMGYNDTFDALGDQYLFFRLRRLADQNNANPLVSLTGSCENIRSCKAQITDYGKAVLTGKAKLIRKIQIDDWIGGVHLNQSKLSYLRQGNTLIAPPLH